MAVCKGCSYTGESLVLLQCHDSSFLRAHVWYASTVRTCRCTRCDVSLTDMSYRWVHVAYTAMSLYLLPLRFITYKKRAWHYFLFDLCYYVNIINFIYIWLLPSNAALFVACYCLSHGPLASAVITWRNSLVFHDQEKVTSLFIHIYPAFTFTVIRLVWFFLLIVIHFTI